MRYDILKSDDFDAARKMCENDPTFADSLQTGCFAAWTGDDLQALILLREGRANGYFAVYTRRDLRMRGIGLAAFDWARARLAASGARMITTAYRAGEEAGAAFCARLGFGKRFSSAYMRRAGGFLPETDAPIRPYEDADYDAAHDLYACAFHEMRVRVGCFPNSAPEPPSEKGRAAWSADRADRIVYVENGEVIAHGHYDGEDIGSLSVRPDRQGHGVGRQMAARMTNELIRRGYAEPGLWCVVGNRARALYESLGYREIFTSVFCERNPI